MTSHEYAAELAAIATRLQDSPSFELAHAGIQRLYFWSDKNKFLAAARALGSGQKQYKDDELLFIPYGTNLALVVNRSAVCRKVQEEKWDCEPLLSPQEEASIETA
jgi:hypothetical protein